jgi:sulfatase modifying factor 1
MRYPSGAKANVATRRNEKTGRGQRANTAGHTSRPPRDRGFPAERKARQLILVPVSLVRAALVSGLVLIAACARPASVVIDPATGFALVALPPGQFVMGSPAGEVGRSADESAHRVTLTRPFYLGQHEVTQDEWRQVLGVDPANHQGCGRCPIERVSFLDVAQFLAAVNERPGGFRYRLPTEAEWEYACRAGTTAAYGTGPALTPADANYDASPGSKTEASALSQGGTVPVESYHPNRWGVFDMEGNVWEWTADWYGPYPPGPVSDPTGPAEGELRVIRGGSFFFDAGSARCAGRYHHRPQDLGFSLGMRLAADRRGSAR